MRSFYIVLFAIVLLSACTSYSYTLEQKLAGKSDEEQRLILAKECSQEIQGGLKPDNPRNVRHFDRMRKICEEMTGRKVPVHADK